MAVLPVMDRTRSSWTDVVHTEPVEATNYARLCGIHVPALQEVVAGKRNRYRIQVEESVMVFHHGCLMTRIYRQGQMTALPPIRWDEEQGIPRLKVLPSHQQEAYSEFLALPTGVRLFCLMLLKACFQNAPLGGWQEDAVTGFVQSCPLPGVLLPILHEVGWTTV